MHFADQPSLTLERLGHPRFGLFDPRHRALECTAQFVDFRGRSQIVRNREGLAGPIIVYRSLQLVQWTEQQAFDQIPTEQHGRDKDYQRKQNRQAIAQSRRIDTSSGLDPDLAICDLELSVAETRALHSSVVTENIHPVCAVTDGQCGDAAFNPPDFARQLRDSLVACDHAADHADSIIDRTVIG